MRLHCSSMIPLQTPRRSSFRSRLEDNSRSSPRRAHHCAARHRHGSRRYPGSAWPRPVRACAVEIRRRGDVRCKMLPYFILLLRSSLCCGRGLELLIEREHRLRIVDAAGKHPRVERRGQRSITHNDHARNRRHRGLEYHALPGRPPRDPVWSRNRDVLAEIKHGIRREPLARTNSGPGGMICRGKVVPGDRDSDQDEQRKQCFHNDNAGAVTTRGP